MRPEELGGDELGMGGMFTKIKPETMAAMVLTGIEGIPLHKVPPLELVVLHPDYAVVKLPMTVVDPLRGVGEESVGAAAFIWSTVPDRGGPRDAFNVYQLLHEWQDFSHRLHEAGHQAVLPGLAVTVQRGRGGPGTRRAAGPGARHTDRPGAAGRSRCRAGRTPPVTTWGGPRHRRPRPDPAR